MTRNARTLLTSCFVSLLHSALPVIAAIPVAEISPLIGYTELRTDLAGGRHANVRTMRAMVVRADGTGRLEVGSVLVDEPDAWTHFAGW